MTGCTSPRMPFANWVDSSPEVGSFKSFLESEITWLNMIGELVKGWWWLGLEVWWWSDNFFLFGWLLCCLIAQIEAGKLEARCAARHFSRWRDHRRRRTRRHRLYRRRLRLRLRRHRFLRLTTPRNFPTEKVKYLKGEQSTSNEWIKKYLASVELAPAAALAKLTVAPAGVLAGVEEAGKPGKFGVLEGWRRCGESVLISLAFNASDTLPDDLFRFLRNA